MSQQILRLNERLGDRYRVEREVGRGGAARVYLAWDHRHQRDVALKVLRTDMAQRIDVDLFRREIETVAGLTHPHVLPLFDSGELDGVPFFVMPYLKEGTLRDRLEAQGMLPPPEAVTLGIQIAEALHVAHEHGVVHRDLKPENVLLNRGHALLVDFGIAVAPDAARGTGEAGESQSFGTPRYMSPEQATGEGTVGPTSDLYSLGCVLMEMLTGRPPFEGRSRVALTAAHVAESPPTLRDRGVTATREVQELLDRLLAKQPSGRPSSAAEVARLLRRAAGPGGAPEGSGGRPREQARILEALRVSREDEWTTVLVRGEAGIGKSTLVHSVAEQLVAQGERVVASAASQARRSDPYHAWRPILARLLGLEGDPSTDAVGRAVESTLGAESELLLLAPLLNDVLGSGIPETPVTRSMDGATRADRMADLVRALLVGAFGGTAPVLLIEDVQWLDAASWALLGRLRRDGGPGSVLLTSRPASDRTLPDAAAAVMGSAALVTVDLGGLDTEGIREVVEGALGAGPIPSALASWIGGRAEGNPFFAREIALALAENGQIGVLGRQVVRSPGAEELDALGLPATVEELVVRRLARLDPAAREALTRASVLGRGFRSEELEAVWDETLGSPGPRLDALVEAQLLVPVGDGFAFAHQITRDVTYGSLDPSARAPLHERFAAWLEERGADGEPEYAQLAHHWRRAGVAEKTMRYGERAAAQGLRSGAYEEALAFARDLLSLDESQGRTAPLARRGRWNCLVAQAYAGLTRSLESAEHAAIALEQIGGVLPRSRRGWVGMITRQVLRQMGHLVRSPRQIPVASEEHARELDLIIAASIHADHRYFDDDALAQFALILLAANTAERLEPVPGVARPLVVLAVVAHMVGLRRLGWRYLKRARALADRAQDPAGWASADMAESCIHFWSGDLEEARRCYLRGRSVAETHSLRRELAELYGVGSNVERARGDLEARVQIGERLIETGGTRGLSEIWGLLVMAQNALRTGDMEEIERHVDRLRQMASRLAHQERASYEALEVHVGIRRQDWPRLRRAVERLGESLGVGSSGQTRIWAHWQSFEALCDGRLELLARAGDYERQQVIKDTAKAIKAHRRFAGTYPVARPNAGLSEGRFLCLQGKVEEGRPVLEAARREALEAGQPYAAARAAQYLGESHPPGSPERTAFLETAARELSAGGYRWDRARVEELLRPLPSPSHP